MPESIKRFQSFWWGSLLFSLLSTWLAWERVRNSLQSRFASDPRMRGNEWAPVVAEWTQPVNVLLSVGLTGLVWFLVVRRASVVGKWLSIALAALGGLQLLILLGGLAGGRTFHPFSHTAQVAAAVLAMFAAAALFHPDARAWFGELDPEEEG